MWALSTSCAILVVGLDGDWLIYYMKGYREDVHFKIHNGVVMQT